MREALRLYRALEGLGPRPPQPCFRMEEDYYLRHVGRGLTPCCAVLCCAALCRAKLCVPVSIQANGRVASRCCPRLRALQR